MTNHTTCPTCGAEGIGDPRSCDHHGTPFYEGPPCEDEGVEA